MKNIFSSWRKMILKILKKYVFQKISISFRDFEIFLITRYKENLKIPKGNWNFSKKSRKKYFVNFL